MPSHPQLKSFLFKELVNRVTVFREFLIIIIFLIFTCHFFENLHGVYLICSSSTRHLIVAKSVYTEPSAVDYHCNDFNDRFLELSAESFEDFWVEIEVNILIAYLQYILFSEIPLLWDLKVVKTFDLSLEQDSEKPPDLLESELWPYFFRIVFLVSFQLLSEPFLYLGIVALKW